MERSDQKMSSLSNSNLKVSEEYSKLRRRVVDVVGRKHLLRKVTLDNKSGQNDNKHPEIQRSRKLTLSKQEDGHSSNSRGKLLMKNEDKNSLQVDSARSNEFPFKSQSQRLCLRRNELLGSTLNPIRLDEELNHRKKWPDPPFERPTLETFKWNSPKVNSDDEVQSLVKESSKCVMDYVRSSKELYDILMICDCSKMRQPEGEKNLMRDFVQQEDSNDVMWVQEGNNLGNTELAEKIKFEKDDDDYDTNENVELQELLFNQQSSNNQLKKSESDNNESIIVIDLVSESSKDSNSQSEHVPLEIDDTLQDKNRFTNTTNPSFNFLSNQIDMENSQAHTPFSTMVKTSSVPLNELAAENNQGVSKYYADLFLENSSEWNEYYSSNLMFLKGDENMVASAKFSEGKVVLHSIKSGSDENQVSWDKDETITLYSDNPAMEVGRIGEGTGHNMTQMSPQSSRSSSSSHSSYSCQRRCYSASSDSSIQILSSSTSSSVKDTCFMDTSCSSHILNGVDLDLHRALEETRNSCHELIVSTLVLHSVLSGRSQKDVVDELMREC